MSLQVDKAAFLDEEGPLDYRNRIVVRSPSGDNANPKDAQGALKPSVGLVPAGAVESVARVMELGAKKYGAYNWRSKPVKKMVYANAALRHLFAWIGGQSVDPESGQSHLAHVAACMMIVLDAESTDCAVEDRVWLAQDPKKTA